MEELPTTEQANPRTERLDTLSTYDMLAQINEDDATVAAVVQTQLARIAEAVEAIAEALRRGGRLIYIGAGTSGRLGVLDASECLPTFGVDPAQVFGILAGGPAALTRSIEGAEDDDAAGAQAMRDVGIGPDDVLVGLSASGGAPYVRAAVRAARERGAITVGIVTAANAPLSGEVAIPIEAVVGPEAIQGSTRLKSGTAQKLICNMLSTGAMVRIGKTYGNRMVDVRATNVKLRARARRLVREIGQVDEARAAQLLDDADGSAKRAIVMARRGLDATAADRALADAGGFLSRALGER